MGSALRSSGSILLLLVAACRDLPSGDDGLSPFSPVVDLRLWSANDSSVGLHWTHSPDVLSFDALDYAVEVRDGPTLLVTRGISRESTGVLIWPLTNGRLYRFDVYLRAIGAPKDFRSGLPVSALWATASRFVFLAGTASPIRIPAVSATARIGLQVFDTTASGPVLRDGALPEGAEIDIVFDATLPAVRAGEVLGAPVPGRPTRFSTMAPLMASTADEPLSFRPDAGSYELTQVPLPLGTVSGGLIMFGKTSSGHVFRLFLRRSTEGDLIHGTLPDPYLEVEVSYQPSTTIGIASAHEN
jgi:hypothetical protein